jgi:hypothetical protein
MDCDLIALSDISDAFNHLFPGTIRKMTGVTTNLATIFPYKAACDFVGVYFCPTL